jgi:hypothetical protein
MTSQQALSHLKTLCDGALKMGLIARVEDAALLNEMFLLIQKRLGEPNTNNHQQLQSPINNSQVGRGPVEVGVREHTSY